MCARCVQRQQQQGSVLEGKGKAVNGDAEAAGKRDTGMTARYLRLLGSSAPGGLQAWHACCTITSAQLSCLIQSQDVSCFRVCDSSVVGIPGSCKGGAALSFPVHGSCALALFGLTCDVQLPLMFHQAS